MPIPLPNKITNNIRENLPNPNLSLKYYKWADFYNNVFTGFAENTKHENPKFDFLNKFVALSGGDAYKQAFETRKRLMEGIGITFTMTTESRLVFGMGYEHPTEIGFMFDWTSGLPIIPGSSLKGSSKICPETENMTVSKRFSALKKEMLRQERLSSSPPTHV